MFEIFTGVNPYNYITSKTKKVESAILTPIESHFKVIQGENLVEFRKKLSKYLRSPLEEFVTELDIKVFIPKAIKAVERAAKFFISDESKIKSAITGLDKELLLVIQSLGDSYRITRDVREYAKNIPQSLADVIIKATEPEPQDRFQSIEELQIALEDLDKVDKGYNKLLRKRVNRVVTLGVLGIGLCLGSIAPYMSYEQSIKDQYQVLVANASKSGNFEDYLKVVEYNPKEIDPYFGLLDAVKQDGVFTKEEESQLLDLLNPNLALLEKSPRFKELAFEVGRLYWLYYNGESSQEVASRWFKDASGYSDLADVYSAIGSFPTEIVKAANEGNDTGMYKKQWSLLDSVTGQSELVSLYIAKARLELINTYPYRLKADGVTKEEIEPKLNEIADLISKSKGKDGRQAEIAKELSTSLEKARKSVEGVYNV